MKSRKTRSSAEKHEDKVVAQVQDKQVEGQASSGEASTEDAANAPSDPASSGMAIDDNEAQRRKDVLKDMEKIEKEFADLKEQLFERKMKDLQNEHKSILEGTHDLFLKRVEELDQKRKDKIWLAAKWRDYQLQNIEHTYQSELKQAEDEFQQEKKILRDQMANEVNEKQKKLEEEKNTMSIRDVNNGEARNAKMRTLRRRGRSAGLEVPIPSNLPPGTRPRAAPPHISYTLNEDEIGYDLMVIRRKDLPQTERKRLFMEAEHIPAIGH